MANPEHLAKLKEGVEAWNRWREANPHVKPDLSKAHLRGENLREVNFSKADLSSANLRDTRLDGALFVGTDLSGAILVEANLASANCREANLSKAQLSFCDLTRADLNGAILNGADLSYANLTLAILGDVDLRRADLTNANLIGAILVQANLEEAILTGCNVYGVAVWDVKLNGANQSNLVLGHSPGQPAIQVDNLQVAQFIYLLLNNENIRDVIDTITSKVVLILGRFTPQRKAVLDAIRDEIRKLKYLPVLFDFQKPDSKDLTGTVTTLANMARFIIADLTDPSSVPHELASIVPTTPVAIQTIILKGQKEYAMFANLKWRYPWVLNPYRYDSQETLLGNLDVKVIKPAEAKAKALMRQSKRSR